MNARAVREAGIDERIGVVDPAAERRDEPLDEDDDLIRIGEADIRSLERAVALDGKGDTALRNGRKPDAKRAI